MPKIDKPFSFAISLSVLNHLGRNLYRSFITVLGEAISNSWDADARNVWIYVDKDRDSFVIKDDGNGMDRDEFQGKFLKIGYSKRTSGSISAGGRPYIGRKGIGKLALLSCAKKITVLTKKAGAEYVGGEIDNSGLDDAIKNDLTPDQYELGQVRPDYYEKYTSGHEHGTILYFDDMVDGIRSSIKHLRKSIALYFRFSLLDDSFSIYVNDEKVTLDDLRDLAEKTQFLWNINDLRDPYVSSLQSLKHVRGDIDCALAVKGFIASVEKPLDLKVVSTEERASVDLFVNGRLRERDILKHKPTARIVESYLYGQIHFNELDEDGKDRFTSSREGIVADDPKFDELLKILQGKILPRIIADWDVWRIEINEDGDSDNTRMPKKARKARELFNVVSEDYSLPGKGDNKRRVDGWVQGLADDARFNFTSYADCFVCENLIRRYAEDKRILLSKEATTEAQMWKEKGEVKQEQRKHKH